ncbi:hypothetical protein ACOBV8_17980 [Pseudoalteromonas espejiana]
MFTLSTIWFLFNHVHLVGAQYLPAVSTVIFIGSTHCVRGYLSTLVMGRKKFSVSNGDLIVKATGAKNKVIKLNEVWGAAKVARRTYLLTKSGAICLGYNLPENTVSPYMIGLQNLSMHRWL